MVLLLVLMIPYAVGKNLMSDRLRTQPEISQEAIASQEVLGVENTRTSNNYDFSLLPYENIFFGIIGVLALFVMISQLNNKNTAIQ